MAKVKAAAPSASVREVPEIVGTEPMAAVLGVTARRVRQLADEGVIRSAGRDRWRLAEVVQAVIASRSQPVGTPESERLSKLKADALETKLMREQGALVAHARAEALATLDGILGPLRSDLYALPARITSDLILRRKIEDHINDVLRAAATRAGEAEQGD